MKKVVLLLLAFVIVNGVVGQSKKNDKSELKEFVLKHRPADHLMLQFGKTGWTNMPDSISSHEGGINVGFNGYFMFDKVFKSSPKLSVGFGLGYSTGSVRFKQMEIDLSSPAPLLPFTDLTGEEHFKKYKITTSFAEVPVELRYTAHPDRFNKSLKFAVGLKFGMLLNASTRMSSLQNGDNKTINDLITQKIKSKRFINNTRFMGTARLGYGVFGIFFNYGITDVLKEGVGPQMKPYQVGLSISGL